MSLLKRLLGSSSPPQDEDIDMLWRELELVYILDDSVRATGVPGPGPNELFEWLEKFDVEAKKESAARLAVEQALSAPPPRYGELFRVRRCGSTKLAGAFLTDRLWAFLFVSLLRLTDSVLARAAAEGKPLGAIGFLPPLFLVTLAKCAAETAGWRCSPELQQEWRTTKGQWLRLLAEDKIYWRRKGTPVL